MEGGRVYAVKGALEGNRYIPGDGVIFALVYKPEMAA